MSENQSILKTPPVFHQEAVVSRAANALRAPRSIFDHVYTVWTRGMENVWGKPELTEEILEKMGEHAAEVFILSGHCRAFLEAVSPGCTAEMYAKMKPFTINEDGTVVLTPEEE